MWVRQSTKLMTVALQTSGSGDPEGNNISVLVVAC